MGETKGNCTESKTDDTTTLMFSTVTNKIKIK